MGGNAESARRPKAALVLSGGGSRGAYEAGVLSWIFENLYPRLGEGFEFDIVSGTSVGAIHGAFVAATAGMKPADRSRTLIDTWRTMRLDNVWKLSWRDFLGIPLRGMGLVSPRQRGDGEQPEALGGLVDIAPLEALVRTRIPWHRLQANLEAGTPSVLCAAATEISCGTVRIFLDGPGADPTPWEYDPHVDAVATRISDLHVRASACIPFLFPSVCIDQRYYVDGGVRLNTPLSPAVRLKADRILVIGLKKRVPKREPVAICDADAASQPAFLLGKLLDVMLLDPIENQLRQLEVINALLEGGRSVYGDDFAQRIAPAVEAARGVDYRPIRTYMQSPSRDLGELAAQVYHAPGQREEPTSLLGNLIQRAATRGVPRDEADFLSYIYFDRAFTDPLLELGREDARAEGDRIFELLEGSGAGAGP